MDDPGGRKRCVRDRKLTHKTVVSTCQKRWNLTHEAVLRSVRIERTATIYTAAAVLLFCWTCFDPQLLHRLCGTGAPALSYTAATSALLQSCIASVILYSCYSYTACSCFCRCCYFYPPIQLLFLFCVPALMYCPIQLSLLRCCCAAVALLLHCYCTAVFLYNWYSCTACCYFSSSVVPSILLVSCYF